MTVFRTSSVAIFAVALLLCGLPAVATAAETCNGGGTGDPKCAGAGNPINVITGNKYQRDTDLPALPGVLGLEIVRHYNSDLSGADQRTGIFGRGWKLSYETELFLVRDTVQILQADGTRLIFSRDLLQPSLCSSPDPANGSLLGRRTGQGEEFVWRQADGRQLSFNAQGKLVQILAPTGEFVSLQHDQRGWLTRVTDPQGRSLQLAYLGSKDSQTGDRFRGVQSIDSPLGRFSYAYGGAAPAGADPATARSVIANLVQVTPPGQGARSYHYEDTRFPTLLTGISVAGQRYATFGYDINGKAVLSSHAGGADKITLDTTVGGRTVLTNSLGQQTVYLHGMVAEQFRLLEVTGAGCALCGEANVRYGYDKLGRLTETTRLSLKGQPLHTISSELDYYGRPLKVSRTHYRNGKAGAAQLVARYQYAAGNGLRPSLISRPSVVPGREYQTRITYGNRAANSTLPLEITESGYIPTLDGKGVAQEIVRTVRYRYDEVGQRIEADGPLENAKASAGPANSDIVRTEYDNKTRLVKRIVAPGGLVTEVVERDSALRPSKVRSSDGFTLQTARIRNNWRGQPDEVVLEAVTLKPGSTEPDPATRMTRTLRYRYDGHGRLAVITQPGGLRTAFAYDAAGRLTHRILPDGSRIVIQQDTEGRKRSEARFAGSDESPAAALASVQYRYDEYSRLVQVDNAQGIQAQLEYTDLGQIASQTNALGIATQFSYNEQGLLTLHTQAANSPDAASVMLAHDSHGKAVAITGANGVTTERRYDDFGRKVVEVNPDRGATIYRHDSAGHIVARIDASDSITHYTYDHANRLVAIGMNDKPALVKYSYRGQRLIDTVSTSDGDPAHVAERLQYHFDSMGQVVRESRWLARVDAPAAEPGIRRVSNKPAYPLGGVRFVTASSYDDAGRLLRQTLPDGHRLTYRYAETGGHQLTELLFDDKVLATGIEQTLAGGMTGYVMGNGVRQKIAFDKSGRIQALESLAQPQVLSAFDKWFAALRSWFGSSAIKNGAVLLYSQTNSYDAAGRVKEIVRSQAQSGSGAAPSEATEQYAYDAMDRLTGMQRSDGVVTRLAYDRGGNRTDESVSAEGNSTQPATRKYHYAAGSNRLTALVRDAANGAVKPEVAWLFRANGVPTMQLAFPNAESLLARGDQLGSRRIAYNSARRPIAVYDAKDRLLARYHYNGAGERIAKTLFQNNAAHTRYSLYRNQRLAAETDEEGRVLTHYIYLYGKPIAKIGMERNTSLAHAAWRWLLTLGGWLGGEEPDAGDSLATIYAIHSDHLGTPQAVSDEAQQVVWRAVTDPFGVAKVSYAINSANGKPFEMNLRLPGQVYDAETGLNQNYYRDYDPRLGRYVTPDPMGIDGGINQYAYASSNPLSNVDPLGLYQSDMHYYMNFFLAVAAGMDPAEARVVALAAQYIDDNPDTEPMNAESGLSDAHRARLLTYHFTRTESVIDKNTGMVSGDSKSYTDVNNAEFTADNTQLKRLFDAIDKAKSDDAVGNKRCTQLQFLGEYLHSFEDTFAHRDKDNVSFPLSWGLGHAGSGSQPDYTFNDVLDSTDGSQLPLGWYVREARTLEAEKQAFAKLTAWGDNKLAFKIEDIEGILKTFNAIKEAEKDGYAPEAPGASKKITFLEESLNVLLEKSGRPGVNFTTEEKGNYMGYSKSQGKSNRDEYLCGKGGGGLDQKNYAGTILPGCK